MVDIRCKRCSQAPVRGFRHLLSRAVGGARTSKQHVDDGMVNVRSLHCSHATFTKPPTFNIVGSKTMVYCRQHSENGMVEVNSEPYCSHASCTTRPTYDFKGGKTPV